MRLLKRTSQWTLAAATLAALIAAGTAQAAPARPGVIADEKLPAPAVRLLSAPTNTPPRCDGDGQSGKRVQLLYVRGDRQADRLEQLRPTFVEHVNNINGRFVQTSEAMGERREVRFVHDSSCAPTITRVVIPQSAMDDPDAGKARDAVEAAGYGRADRKYVVWTENTVCGLGWGGRGDQRTGDANENNWYSGWAMVGLNGCFGNPDADVHELLHTMGAVHRDAPYATTNGHCFIYGDLMCYDDGGIPNPPGRMINCPNPGEGWIDCNHDSYFNPRPRAGGYLSSHWNIADSLFLIRGGGGSPGLPTSRVNFTNAANGYVADVDYAQTADGTKVKLEGEHGHDASRWNLAALGDGTYRITPVLASGSALDANTDRSRVVDGTSYFAQIWGYGGGANQKWRITSNGDGTYKIVAFDGGCLTGENPGSALGVWACTGAANQKWRIAQ
ncbi:hypothetical protein Afil01_07950 [Actinorhabdospora filicis]|uniref:Ricin B lectin domain-containing protein n=1 Tax=Actinorhabdospora filicis TaxID=1785913 RepID=A0A9W6SHA7_9ACTN|nr:RICIN domain-containing protein [Actinorhabdospora filicis]GLZ75988.1 hypothetical protein Afil01_07950 [Actinorhabdospora filicis]